MRTLSIQTKISKYADVCLQHIHLSSLLHQECAVQALKAFSLTYHKSGTGKLEKGLVEGYIKVLQSELSPPGARRGLFGIDYRDNQAQLLSFQCH